MKNFLVSSKVLRTTVLLTAALIAVALTGCPTPESPDGDTAIAFSNLAADGSTATTTSKLTLTFDKDLDGLSAADLTLDATTTGAEKGTLTRTGTGMYDLALSGITATGTVTLSVAKAGYVISPTSKTAEVLYTPEIVQVAFSGLAADGSTTTTTTKLTLTFDKDIEDLSAADLTLDAASTGVEKGTLTKTGTGSYELALSGVAASGTVTLSVVKTGYVISPTSKTAEVYFYLPPGDMETYSADGISFKLAAVPGGITFPTRSTPTGNDDTGEATVADPYRIGEFEVTWKLWNTVREWAVTTKEGDKYTLPVGNSGNTTGTGGDDEPVARISRNDAVVWCNALTEYYNAKTGSNLRLVYLKSTDEPIRDSSDAVSLEMVAIAVGSNGFRLPTSDEWELAAKWQGTTPWPVSNTNSITKNGYYFTPGDSASGATANTSDATASNLVAWYTNSTDFPGGTKKTQTVGQKAPNVLGLYDMSGNVYEYCSDLYDSYGTNKCIVRGGSFSIAPDGLQTGLLSTSYPPTYASSGTLANHGFRIARSIP
jgi:formylglycine-generating enzyme required for sulfatase activity